MSELTFSSATLGWSKGPILLGCDTLRQIANGIRKGVSKNSGTVGEGAQGYHLKVIADQAATRCNTLQRDTMQRAATKFFVAVGQCK